MKKRSLAFLLAILLLFSLVSCGPSEDPGSESGQTTESTSVANTETESATETESVSIKETETTVSESSESETETVSDTETVSETETETETETEVAKEITVTTGDITYVATNHSAYKNGVFTVNQDFEVTFDKPLFKEGFNRLTFSYEASEPMHVFVTYKIRGREFTDDFYLEARHNSFNGLISGYLDGKEGASVTKIVFDTCKETDASFILKDLSADTIPYYPNNLYIENERFKFGVRLGWGGAITYFEDKQDGIDDLGNLVNIHDTGRLIQQSFYGTFTNDEYTSGINSGNTPWPYNPVQGGDMKNNGSRRLIDVEVGDDYIYIKTQPLDWAFDENITLCYYENKYTIYDDRVVVDNVLVDFSGWDHIAGGQEIPAVYLVSYFDTLAYYNGIAPWTNDDAIYYERELGGWGVSKNIALYEENTETWSAWLNTVDGFGAGIYAPNIDSWIAIRHEYDGSKDPMANSTSYVAPSIVSVMESYVPIEYSYIMTTGTLEEIRSTFTEHRDFATNESLDHKRYNGRTHSSKTDMTDIDFSLESKSAYLGGGRHTITSYDEAESALKLTVDIERDPYVFLDFTANAENAVSADDYNAVEIEYMIPATNSSSYNILMLFLCSGEVTKPTDGYTVSGTIVADGKYHTLSLRLPKDKWSGEVYKIRVDYFLTAAVGDCIYIKSFKLMNYPDINIENDFTHAGCETVIASNRYTEISFSADQSAMMLEVLDPNDVNVELDFSNLGLNASDYGTVEIEYMIPETNKRESYSCALYICAGDDNNYSGGREKSGKFSKDGEYHTLTVTLEGVNGWDGVIKKIRFDYFEGCEAGDVIYIKSINLK